MEVGGREGEMQRKVKKAKWESWYFQFSYLAHLWVKFVVLFWVGFFLGFLATYSFYFETVQ